MARLHVTPVRQPDRILSYWKRERRVIAAVVLFGVLFNGSMSIGPILQGRLIDALASGQSREQILWLAASFVGTILLIQCLRYLKRYYVRVFANRTCASMRLMLYHNIMRRNVMELSHAEAGDLMTRAVSDVDICTEGMRKVTTEVFDTGVLMLTYLVTLFLYDVRISLIACSFVPVAMWLAERLKKSITGFSKEARAQMSRVSAMTQEHAEHALLYRVNGVEARSLERYGRELDILKQKSIRANILENSMQPVYNVVALIGILAVLIGGGRNVIAGGWTVGVFSAYLTVFTALATKASKAAKLFNTYQKAAVSWRRVKPYLAEYREKPEAGREDLPEARLSVEHLSFTYPDGGKEILHDLTFSAKAGDIIGVTGPVACGKSTLGLALTGLFPYAGSIRLSGTELSACSETERSRRIAWMGHDPELLSDTIYENVTLGDPGEIDGVLDDAGLTEDIARMPDGIRTEIGASGTRLSGGQQARVALARALYRNAQILILDDPFSAVDMTTERAIMERLREKYRYCIIVLISHRLSAFPMTDRVIVLHADRTAEYGTHERLLQTSALYASIFRMQRGGAHEA